MPQNDRRGTLESDKDSSAVPQNDKGGAEYSPCHPERSEGSWEWRRASWRVTKILRFAQNDKRGTLEDDKDSSAVPQNDRGGTLEDDKDSSAVPQNDRGGTLEDDKDSSAAPQNDKFGGGRVTRILRLCLRMTGWRLENVEGGIIDGTARRI